MPQVDTIETLQDRVVRLEAQVADLTQQLHTLLAVAAKVDGIFFAMNEIREKITGTPKCKDWYSTAELAKAMNVTAFTVTTHWCNRGRIECEKDPDTGRWRIPGQEYLRLIQGGGLRRSKGDTNGTAQESPTPADCGRGSHDPAPQ